MSSIVIVTSKFIILKALYMYFDISYYFTVMSNQWPCLFIISIQERIDEHRTEKKVS